MLIGQPQALPADPKPTPHITSSEVPGEVRLAIRSIATLCPDTARSRESGQVENRPRRFRRFASPARSGVRPSAMLSGAGRPRSVLLSR
jgi:hypothetical protein